MTDVHRDDWHAGGVRARIPVSVTPSPVGQRVQWREMQGRWRRMLSALRLTEIRRGVAINACTVLCNDSKNKQTLGCGSPAINKRALPLYFTRKLVPIWQQCGKYRKWKIKENYLFLHGEKAMLDGTSSYYQPRRADRRRPDRRFRACKSLSLLLQSLHCHTFCHQHGAS